MPKEFVAIVVGGGPVGLGMAHALSLAGIDFVVLEQRDSIVEDVGFGIALWPHGVRILDQFGLLETALRDLWLQVCDKYTLLSDGSKVWSGKLFGRIHTNHGHPWLNMRRRDFVELLYTAVPDRERRILTGKKAIAIETHDTGVVVRCEDGSRYEGSIVIGCDGVYSRVRELMEGVPCLSPKEEAAAAAAKASSDSKTAMYADFQLFFGYVDHIDKLEDGTVHEIHNGDFSCQTFNHKTDGYWMAYRRLPRRAYGPVRYSEADGEAFAAEFMDRLVAPGVLFRDLWRIRRWTRLVNIEEGQVHGPWHRGGRVVLVGDAVHKMTPNAGLSLNTGWQGVAELTNRLRALLLPLRRDDADAQRPGPEALAAVFSEYQRQRQGPARLFRLISSLYTRNMGWYNGFYQALDRAAPFLGGDHALLGVVTSPLIQRGVVLDFVPEPGHRAGSFRWHRKPLDLPPPVAVLLLADAGATATVDTVDES